MKKIKIAVFILLIVSLFVVLFYSIFGTQLSFLSVEEIKEDRVLNQDLITELKINNMETVYDKNNNIYYYMIADDYENNIYVLNLELDSTLKYKIIDETLNIIKVNYEKPIKIIIYNDKYYYETKIQLTNLPLINIITEDKISFSDTKTVFNYINSEAEEKFISNNSVMRVRGATSSWFDKKGYKINFSDKNYIKDKKIRISNFYYGDSLILDAVYRDPSKIRNVLATQIWNDISSNFTNVNMYSEFVEVFINNEYVGLYVLTEPVNRTNLNLNKSSDKDTSVVIKSQSWNSVNSKIKINNINDDTFMDYELKYPNDTTLYSESWKKILAKLSKYYDKYTDSSYDKISSTFNIENYIDLVIYNAFINNKDNNLKKNNYFYVEDLHSDEIFIHPWDMEFSFGTTFSDIEKNNIKKDMNDYNVIYTNLIHKDSKINNLLINRYWELRNNVLTKNYFDNLLDKYKNELNKGAALRDSNKWYEYDVEKEIEEIRTWIYNRIEFFDGYVSDLENE